MGSKKVRKKFKNKNSAKYLKIKKRRYERLNFFLGGDECLSLDDFSQIRENYFVYLQKVIKENMETSDTESLFTESLERISLEVEQQALFACMRSDIYRKIMIKIINEIRKSTQEMKLYLGIKNILMSKNLEVSKSLSRLKTEERNSQNEVIEMPEVNEIYSHIPTISSVGPAYDELEGEWLLQNILCDGYDSNTVNGSNVNNDKELLQSINTDVSLTESLEVDDMMDTVYPSPRHQLTVLSCPKKFTPPLTHEKVNKNGKLPGATGNHMCFAEGSLSVPKLSDFVLPESNKLNIASDTIESLCDLHALHTSSEGIDPILKSRSKLRKSVEQSLKNFKELKFQQKEEKERAEIARILEDSDDNDNEAIDASQCGSLSDNCDVDTNVSDSKHNLFADRLDEIRQLFGMEEDQKKIMLNTEVNRDILNSSKYIRRCKLNKQNSPWYHERIIQMYRLSVLTSEMTEASRIKNRCMFFECFGEDSDEENLIHFQREDKYITSCKERISSWVVKYLMPFYHKKRIVGRNVFKSLGHHISHSIVEQIKYPDEWTVKYFVNRFFPMNRKFLHESDVYNFQI